MVQTEAELNNSEYIREDLRDDLFVMSTSSRASWDGFYRHRFLLVIAIRVLDYGLWILRLLVKRHNALCFLRSANAADNVDRALRLLLRSASAVNDCCIERLWLENGCTALNRTV